MYPSGVPEVTVAPGPLGDRLEGAERPGHFRGVLTTPDIIGGKTPLDKAARLIRFRSCELLSGPLLSFRHKVPSQGPGRQAFAFSEHVFRLQLPERTARGGYDRSRVLLCGYAAISVIPLSH